MNLFLQLDNLFELMFYVQNQLHVYCIGEFYYSLISTIWYYKESYEPCNYGLCISALETICDCLKYVVFCIIIMRLVSLGCLQHVVWGAKGFRTVLSYVLEKLVISISLGLGQSEDNR